MIKNKLNLLFSYLNIPILYSKTSYSQEGEDLVINNIFKNIKNGYYLDIGAYHPYKYSNTQLLYKKGWCGINIEPNKNNIKLFNLARKRDINLNIGIGSKSVKMKYYTFEDPALNTFKYKNYIAIIKTNQSKFIGSYHVKVKTLDFIIKKYIKNNKVDYVNIDTEGSSSTILKSLISLGLKPQLVSVERENSMGKEIDGKDKILLFMRKKGYILIYSSSMTFIFSKILA